MPLAVCVRRDILVLVAPGLTLALAKNKQKKIPSMTSNVELLYYMLGQVNQERDWDLQALYYRPLSLAAGARA